MIARLLDASDKEGADPWLADMTNYRNVFLHQEPMSTTARWLVVEERDSPVGAVRTISMPINARPADQTTCDALTRFVDLYARLCRLADFATTLAPYAAKPPEFSATGP